MMAAIASVTPVADERDIKGRKSNDANAEDGKHDKRAANIRLATTLGQADEDHTNRVGDKACSGNHFWPTFCLSRGGGEGKLWKIAPWWIAVTHSTST